MEPELAALATGAATTLVRLLATESWEQARDAVARLWHRVHPERAEAVTADLDDSRAELLTALQDGDAQAEQELIGEWRRRLGRLIQAGGPELVDELRRAIDELSPRPPEATAPSPAASGCTRRPPTAAGSTRPGGTSTSSSDDRP
ncbi:hypothetical protein [Kitasatospora sp. NPDC001175]|uniref:hypothetical protein n=1 Tax=Kitasatospora sp. NPDC001175 TaxID=3157103 RepID=UPI003CFCF35D